MSDATTRADRHHQGRREADTAAYGRLIHRANRTTGRRNAMTGPGYFAESAIVVISAVTRAAIEAVVARTAK
ncbi:hypothetical protein JCM9534A_24270 [Catenuloplanes indicus JCM 9534]